MIVKVTNNSYISIESAIIENEFEPRSWQQLSEKETNPFDKLENIDIRFYISFIAFSIQCLFVWGKWETIVHTIESLDKITSSYPSFHTEEHKYMKIYLHEYLIYAEDKIYQTANAKLKDKRDELKLRVQQFTIGK